MANLIVAQYRAMIDIRRIKTIWGYADDSSSSVLWKWEHLGVPVLLKEGAVWLQHLCVKVVSGEGGKDTAVGINSKNNC